MPRPGFTPEQQRILAMEYPRFSDAEYARRHRLLAGIMARHDLDHLLVVTDHRAGNAPQWVTGWPGTNEAYVVFRPGERMTMYVEWHNHVPLAKRIARDGECCDVRWGEHRGIALAAAELARRGAKRVGVIGPLPVSKWRALEAKFELQGLEPEYLRCRQIKSEEELDWYRIGAAFSDLGFESLLAGTRPGLDERELAALVEQPYVARGGTTMIHYIGVTSMAAPRLVVPPQYASTRRVAPGDVVICELSAYFWDYAGQVLRTYFVDAEPTPLYRDLLATAYAAYDAVTREVRHGATMQALIDASGVIEAAGFTVCDDLVHGFGGGYYAPILGSASRPAGPLPDMTLEENMTIVVQPNVISPAHGAGVQVGELIRVTRDGCERLHALARGPFRAGQRI
jgi:Xaa-Pro aminopeptidase